MVILPQDLEHPTVGTLSKGRLYFEKQPFLQPIKHISFHPLYNSFRSIHIHFLSAVL